MSYHRYLRMVAGAGLACLLVVVFTGAALLDRIAAAARWAVDRSLAAFGAVCDFAFKGFRTVAAPRIPAGPWESAPLVMTPDHRESTSTVAYLEQYRRAGHTIHPRVQSRTDHSRGFWRAVSA